MLQIVVLIVLSILILRWPYLGIAVTLASLPLIDILPEISWASSVVALLGGVTLVSFILSQFRLKYEAVQGRSKMSSALLVGFLFVLWMVLSNPSAAIEPEPDGRVWVVTFIQLWIFVWLTVSLFDNPQKIDILMFLFVVVAFISAVYAGFQGVIGKSVLASVRAVGLAAGANSAARYFVVALMFALFLFPKQRNIILKILLIGAMIVLLYGVFLTISRTGLLLLVGGMGLYIMQNLQSRKIAQPIFILLLVLSVVWLFAENIVSISKSILPSIMAGTDTVRLRYGLWQAGIRMWVDHPIAGVGIGKFGENLARYGWDIVPVRYQAIQLGAHNMYIAILSETGIIGLFIFIGMFVLALKDLVTAMRSSNTDISDLAKNWIIVIILVLLAGITKHDQYDKLNWIMIGIAVSISKLSEREQIV